MLLSCLVFMLCGCSAEENQAEEERFSISKEKQEEYKAQIDEVINSFYWNYDEDTLAYYDSHIPSENTGGIFDASNESGYNLERYKGREAVVYTGDLYYFNGEKAGIVYFYFAGNNVVGVCYSPVDREEEYFSLNDRNLFKSGVEFKKYEDTSVNERSYNTYKVSSNLYEGFSDIYNLHGQNTYLIAIDGNYIKRYSFSRSYFSMKNNINIASLCGLEPLSAAMLENGETAVMVGSHIQSQEDNEGAVTVVAEKIIFLNENFSKTDFEIDLTGSTYSSVARCGNGFVAINDKKMDIYSYVDGKYEKSGSSYINVQATDFKEVDIDGDGMYEFVLTDGKDLLIYRRKGTGFENIWRTNISVESFYGYIYTGDLNGDDVNEIYICDNTGTAIKYIVTPKGLVSDNEEINYGNRIYAGDFNGDGKDDYLFVDDVQEGSITLNLCE